MSNLLNNDKTTKLKIRKSGKLDKDSEVQIKFQIHLRVN